MNQTISQDPSALIDWLNDMPTGDHKQQITRTVYDVAYPNFAGLAPLGQVNLRNRVSYIQVFDAENIAHARVDDRVGEFARAHEFPQGLGIGRGRREVGADVQARFD